MRVSAEPVAKIATSEAKIAVEQSTEVASKKISSAKTTSRIINSNETAVNVMRSQPGNARYLAGAAILGLGIYSASAFRDRNSRR